MSGKTPLRFPLVLFLILIPLLTKIDQSESTRIYCCRGWSDDVSKPGQMDVHLCDNVCQSLPFCTDSTNKDCVTSWNCVQPVNGQRPNITDADCSKPDVDKACYCDTDWCNCPQALKNKETPDRETPLKCCFGSSAEAPEELIKQACDWPRKECTGKSEDNNVTSLYCADANGERLRENCYSYSYKKYAVGDESENCRCTTDYCNCPSSQKPNETTGAPGPGGPGGGGAGQMILNTQFSLLFWSYLCIMS